MANKSYFQERMEQIGFHPEKHWAYFNAHPDEPFGKKVQKPLFQNDRSGNIEILYPDLDRTLIAYDESKAGSKVKYQPYVRKRMADPGEGPKYLAPKGKPSLPYLPLPIIEKYQKGENITILVITEGEFKAFVGAEKGLDVIGIPGIHQFRDPDDKKLHPLIAKIIQQCQVKNVILLFDADCLEITYEEGKDLAKRPYSFYTAVKNFRECLKPLGIDAYFAHIRSNHAKTFKGLDDMLLHGAVDTAQVTRDLELLSAARTYLFAQNISDSSLTKLKSYFFLQDVKDFHRQYEAIIGDNPFIFHGSQYQHIEGKLKLQRHQDADLYLRVGPHYLKQIQLPNKHGELENQIVKWKKEEIKQDYRQIPNFIDQIPKYNAFCNVPDNSPQYRRVHNNCYNLYEPLRHQAIEGDWSDIRNFIQHIFAEGKPIKEGQHGDYFTMALDYLTILLRYPAKKLPILCLVSRENNTGKTTFLRLLQYIFGNNATILGNEQFQMSFNAHYITKLLIGIDESFIQVEKKKEKERIKQLATSDRQFLQYKGVDVQEIDYFGKLIMCSNDEDNFVQIDQSETRWWILKVNPFTGPEDPHLMDKMKTEVPAFLHHLFHREIAHPEVSRTWFATEFLQTEQLKRVVKSTQSRLASDLEDYLKWVFIDLEQDEFQADPTRIAEQLNIHARYKHHRKDISRYLKDTLKMRPTSKTVRYKLPVDNSLSANENAPFTYSQYSGRTYTFSYQDWVDESDFQDTESLTNHRDRLKKIESAKNQENPQE